MPQIHFNIGINEQSFPRRKLILCRTGENRYFDTSIPNHDKYFQSLFKNITQYDKEHRQSYNSQKIQNIPNNVFIN